MIKKIFLIIIFIPNFSSFFAEEDFNYSGKKIIDNFLNEVITFDSKFDQSLVDADGITLEQVSGTLEIERSTMKFRWSYNKPYKQWLIADGLNVWNYDFDLGQVIVKPQIEVLAGTPAILFSNSNSVFQQFNLNSVSIEGNLTWVELEPKNKIQFQWIKLGFTESQLIRMEFLDNLDQKILIIFYDVKQNQNIDSSRFKITITDDIDVIGSPVSKSLENKY